MIKVFFELENPICSCEWDSPGDWGWELAPDEKHWLGIRCKKCDIKLLTNIGARVRYYKDKKKEQTKPSEITRTMTKREAQIFDAIKSELYGVVKHRFEDGFYWVDLCTSYSEEEARLMDHCGKDKRGSLWSLRDSNKVPHLTITVEKDKVICLRGRHNKAPKNIGKYKHCIDYLNELGLEFNLEEIVKKEE